MADRRSGKAIFDQRVEYPLPKRAGVRDYVVDLVPADDDYAESARKFLGRFYRGHRTGSARSLEELIGFLRTDLDGVTQLRELVIVCHAAPSGLIFPIVRNTSAGDPEFQNVTALGLARLQKEFRSGRRTDFDARRAFVAQRLKEDSWITIRACRPGQGADVMYALFSFFGGRANIYAPAEYMFFGDHPIESGTRVASSVDVHDHLVKQRLFPSDVHTPERQDGIVAAVVDPGRFGEPFDLASTRIDETTSEAAIRYRTFVAQLDRRRIDPGLRTIFADQGHELSKRVSVRLSRRSEAWIVTDDVDHPDLKARLTYDVAEEVEASGTRQVATLRASATIVDRDRPAAIEDDAKQRGPSAVSYGPTFPVQLFFLQGDKNQFAGLIEKLAGYRGSGPPPDAFKALHDPLPTAKAAPIPVPGAIVTAIADRAKIELSPLARLQLADTKTKDGLVYREWAIEDAAKYLIKLEHPPSRDVRAHVLSLYHDLHGDAGLAEKIRMTGYLGLVPDTPGTELAAYLDRASIDELVSLIDYLRAPYRSEHSFYIHHAQLAIQRKKEWSAWLSSRSGGSQDPLGFLVDPYENLTGSEAEDKRHVAHEFPFNSVWREVKVSHPNPGVPQVDLFAEEDLMQKLRIADGAVSAALEIDSPASSIDELRRAEGPAPDGFKLVEKDELEFADEPGLDCQEFTALLQRWQALEGTDEDEIRRLLGQETASDGKTFLDHILEIKEALEIPKLGKKLISIAFDRPGRIVKIVSKIPWVGVPSALGTPTTFVALLRIRPAFTIAYDLWMRSAEAEEHADEVAETTGKVVAVRQWLRELIAETTTPDFPEGIDIDLRSGPDGTPMGRYFKEQQDDDLMSEPLAFPFVLDLDRLEKGFDAGIRMMEKATDEILERADDAIDDVFRELDIDACKAKALADVGVLDMRELRAFVVRELCFDLLRQIPKA